LVPLLLSLAHLSGGLDFRLNRGLGIGPMIDFGMGTSTRAEAEASD